MPALRLGLTGGIGSGKTTVAALFSQRQFPVIDADGIARECTAPNGIAMDAIRNRFGAAMVAADGSMDRNAMRAAAFSEPSVRIALQDIIHPLVRQEMERQTRLAESAGAACIVFDIPLLTESPQWRQRLQQVLVVDCSEETQRLRVQARDKLDDTTVSRIIQAQSPRTHRLRCADFVIHNDGISLQELGAQVEWVALEFGL